MTYANLIEYVEGIDMLEVPTGQRNVRAFWHGDNSSRKQDTDMYEIDLRSRLRRPVPLRISIRPEVFVAAEKAMFPNKIGGSLRERSQLLDVMILTHL